MKSFEFLLLSLFGHKPNYINLYIYPFLWDLDKYYNLKYFDGLERLLTTLSEQEIPIIEILNDSGPWKERVSSKLELSMDFDYPIQPWEHGARELRLAIGKKTGAGSPAKRIKFVFENWWDSDRDYIEQIFSGFLG